VPYGSSQNGENGIGGTHERPSANKPSLWTMAARGTLPTPRASEVRGPGTTERHPSLYGLARLPTPTATDCKASGVAGNWTPGSGRNAGATLTDVVVRQLPTPSARDWKSGTVSQATLDRNARPLNEVITTGDASRRLSPRFVEWMMGLPIGWTEIGPTDSMPLEMESSHKQLPEPSTCSGSASTESHE
jgi:hypothetical protein